MNEQQIVDQALHDLQAHVQTMRDRLTQLRRRYPRQILLENLRNLQYEVVRAIPVVLEEDEGQYVATWYDADLFGYGDREQDALEDLCETIVSLWEGALRSLFHSPLYVCAETRTQRRQRWR